jgi:hypothetical protein
MKLRRRSCGANRSTFAFTPSRTRIMYTAWSVIRRIREEPTLPWSKALVEAVRIVELAEGAWAQPIFVLLPYPLETLISLGAWPRPT